MLLVRSRAKALFVILLSVLLGGQALAPVLTAQGMGSGVKAIPRSSPLARPELATPAIRFTDITAQTGIDARNVYGGEKKKRYILEMTGNGVGLIDIDNDHDLDVILVNGTKLDGAIDGEPPVSRIYLNNGDGTFKDATGGSGLDRTGWGQGVCAGDYDNDGHTDILITYFGHNSLYRNLGEGRFQDVTGEAGLPVDGHRWSTNCNFLDYDRDGNLDLFITNYIELNLEEAMEPGSTPYCSWRGVSVFCGPRGFPGEQNRLYHNEGDGRFRDVSREAGIFSDEKHYNLGSIAADFNNDGWPDIFVACDSTPGRLYSNNQDGTFTDIGVIAGVAYSDDGLEEGSMGATAGDYDNNGWLDIVITNFMDETSTPYHNEGDWFFQDMTYVSGLGVNTSFVGWGLDFLDLDQDGWKDMVLSNGHIYPELIEADVGEPFELRKILYWNLRNGAFRDISAEAGAAFMRPRSSRGLATGDLDGDGVPEIVFVNMNEPPTVLKNTGVRGRAILVQLEGTESNRSAIGARVAVTAGGFTQIDEVRSGGAYASQRAFALHFGLGEAGVVERLTVRWPSGSEEEFVNVKAGQTVRIREGDGIVERVPFRSVGAGSARP